ncbi:MAG TPA: hypothetical protein DEA05_05580 [Rhodobacteraceae bacterium]|nr:hypothetical protein [Paracoccaceae bacterium]
MDLTAQIDAYCERTDPGLWAEPLNAVTNLAFLVAAAVMAARLRGTQTPQGWALVVLLALIGIGSGLWHTLAQGWTGLADVLPILGFVLVYIYAVVRAGWGLGRRGALALTAGFFPFAAATVPLFARLPLLGESAAYLPVWALIAAHGLLLRARAPEIARGCIWGASILGLSLLARSLDEPLCAVLPMGTHQAWHLLNALMLAVMIEALRRHHLARPGAEGARTAG